MNDNIDIPLQASGEDGIERLIAAIDRLHGGLEGLGKVTGLTRLEQQMQVMQASMTTGFAEVAALVQKGGAQVVAAHVKTDEQIATVKEKNRDRQLNADRTFLRAQEAMNEAQLRTDVVFSREVAKVAAARAGQRVLEHAREEEVERKWLAQLEAAREKELSLEALFNREVAKVNSGQAAQRALDHAREEEVERKWLAQLAADRERELALEAAFNREVAKVQGQRLAEAAASAERQRVLNTNFMTAGPVTQIRQAAQAQTYLQQPGATRESAIERYGSAAVASDVNALRAAHAALTPAVNGSRGAVESHNHAMNEAHSLARGLAGSLGGLWLTYGSLVPLAAGAAIAASLKSVVTVGAEVEHQLTNVLAITGSGVNLDQFLKVSDGSLHSLSEGANAMRMLAQNGLSASESLQVLPAVLNLATAGEMTVAQAALAATGAASAFGLGYTEAGRIADIFAKTAANSNTSVLAMTESMKQASTVASLFKVSIEETAGMLGLLAKINVTGGAAGTSFTNMLTGLYEPTEKGKKALKELGVETQLASGQLKPFTQLLEEMKGSLSGFTDAARVDLLGSIFTVRGVKAAELALQNLDQYKEKVGEAATASGFMADVVRRLEDDTTGGFQRLGVTVQNSFVRSFAEASPYVQHIALQLSEAFRDGGAASTGLQNFATNIARLTATLVDNLGLVTTLGAGYVAWRTLMPPVIIAIKSATAATAASTAAQEAAAVANAAHATAMSAGAATTATYTVAVEASTVATEAATAATLAWEAVLLPILGAVAIAVGVGAAAWLLFRDNTSEADKANQKIANSLQVVEDALERENKRLDENLKLWDAKKGIRLAPETVSQDAVDTARAQVARLEKQARDLGQNPDDLRNSPGMGYDPGSGAVTIATPYQNLADALVTADDNLNKLLATQRKFKDEVEPKQALEKAQNATAQLREELDKFYKQGFERDSKGELYQQNAAARAVSLKAAPLWEDLLDSSKVLKDPKEELDRVNALSVSLRKLNDERNAVLSARAPKEDKRGENDAYREALTKLDEQVQQAQKRAQTTVRDLQSAYQVGAISAVEAAQKEHDAQVASLNTAIEMAQKKAALARGQEHGRGDAARFGKDESAARAGILEADAKLQRDYDAIVRKSAEETTQYRIDQARKEHNTALAYQLEHESALKQIDKGLIDSREMLNASLEKGDAKGVTAALAMLSGFEDAKSRTDAAIKTATNADEMAKAVAAFDSLLAKVKAGISDISTNLRGAGLGSMVRQAFDSQSWYDKSVPGLQKEYGRLQAAADNTGLPEDQAKADKALADINKQALQLQQVWTNTGKAIEKSLTDAFGKSGKAAIAMTGILVAESRREKQIRDALAASKGDADYARKEKEAIEDIRSARIGAYGDMASAAKGFFSEGSSGYAALSAAEKAFRLVEIADATKSFLIKSGLLTSYLAVKVGTDATAAASTATYTAFEVAQAAVRATAHAVVAAVSAMAGWPFPLNMIALGGTIAAIAALGVKITGGGGGMSANIAQERQAATGTGTVFGDSKAKSDSLARALQNVSDNSNIDLTYTAAMVTSLRNIENSLGGLGNVLIRGGGLTGELAPNTKGAAASFGESTLGKLVIGGPFHLMLDKLTGGWVSKTLGKVSNSVFGGNTTTLDTGLTASSGALGALRANGVLASQYTDTKTDGGWFRSDRYRTQLTSLGAEANQQLTQVVDNLALSVTEAGKLLGVAGDDFTQHLNSFVVDIGKISMKGLTGEEIQKQLEAAFSKLGDDMAKYAVGGLEQFQKVGEGYFETMVRIASDYANLNSILGSIGMTFGATGLASISTREHLIELAGGIDKLASQTSSFAHSYLTKAEQLAPVAKYVAEQLNSMNLGWVDTREEFKNVVLGLNLADPASQQLYVSLMALQDAFAKVHASTVDLTKSEQEIADERADLQKQLEQLTLTEAQLVALERSRLDVSNRTLYDQVQAAKAVKDAKDNLNDAYEAEKKNIEDLGDRMGKLSSDWKKLMYDLQLGDNSPLTPQQKYTAAKAEFEKTLAAAKGGDKVAQDAYQDVASKFLEASRVANASSDTYTADFNRVMQATGEAATWAALQVDVAKESLKALKAQVTGLVDVKQEVTSVKDAILKLAEAQGVYAASSQAGSSPAGAISTLYQSLLGRAPDADGLQFWTSKLSQGVSLTDIAAAMRGSSEYMQKPDTTNLSLGGSASASAMAAASYQPPTAANAGPSAAQVERMIGALEGLRGDMALLSNAQVEATMTAAATMADQVAESVEQGVSKAAWIANSGATIDG